MTVENRELVERAVRALYLAGHADLAQAVCDTCNEFQERVSMYTDAWIKAEADARAARKVLRTHGLAVPKRQETA